jgi:hypothetical protein
MPSSLIIDVLAGPLSICRLAAGAPIPAWATAAPFFTVTRTADELSIICATDRVPDEVTASGGWRALKLVGPFDLTEVGILLRVAAPPAAARVSMLPVATYDTDYVLVRAPQLAAAVAALRGDGHELRMPEALTDAPAI